MGDPTVEVIGKQQQGQKSRENASGLTGTDPSLTTQSSLIASTKQGSVPNIVTSATSVLPTPALQQNVGVGENQTSAADLVASILNGMFYSLYFYKYRIVASTNTCHYSENQIFYSLE